MSYHDNRNLSAADEPRDPENSETENAAEEPDITPSGDATQAVARRAHDRTSALAPLVLPPSFWDRASDAPEKSWTGALRRPALALAALAVAVVALGAATFVAVDHRQQADLLSRRAQENAELAQTVSALNARLQAIEATRGRDELAELRRSIGDMKSAAATSHELSAAIAQLSQRVEKLDREQGAKLDEHVDRETGERTAELAARLDKLEKKPTPPTAPPPPAAQPPKFGGNVSMDPTGSIDRPRQVLRGYVVLGAQNDIALIGGRYGELAVRSGDYLPGAGRVERVERQGPNWVVVTEQGVIASAYAAPN